MAEQKKPFPDNKHETRISTETRPAGIAPSAIREQPGGSVDIIEVVAEKPRVVRVSQEAYARMVDDGTQFFARDFFDDMPNAATSTWTTFATASVTNAARITVPRGMAFDLTHMFFSAMKATSPFWFPAHDEAMLAYVRFRVAVNNVTPYDFLCTSGGAAGVLGGVVMGLPWLNRDHLALGGDCPVHIVAVEGQRVEFQYYHYAGALHTVFDGNANTLIWGGSARGRWIPLQHYRRIVSANSLE